MNPYSPKRAFVRDAYNAGVAKWIIEELCGKWCLSGMQGLQRPADYNTETQERKSFNELKPFIKDKE